MTHIARQHRRHHRRPPLPTTTTTTTTTTTMLTTTTLPICDGECDLDPEVSGGNELCRQRRYDGSIDCTDSVLETCPTDYTVCPEPTSGYRHRRSSTSDAEYLTYGGEQICILNTAGNPFSRTIALFSLEKDILVTKYDDGKEVAVSTFPKTPIASELCQSRQDSETIDMRDSSSTLQLTSNGNIIETRPNQRVILHMLNADRTQRFKRPEDPLPFLTNCPDSPRDYSVNGTYEGGKFGFDCRPYVRKLGNLEPCFVAELNGLAAANSLIIGFYQANGTEYLALQTAHNRITQIALERFNFVSSSGEPCPFLPFAPGYSPAKKMVRLIS